MISIMKTSLTRAWVLFSLGCAALGGPVDLTISPANVTNDYVGEVTLTITGLANGQTVNIERFADLNGNGLVDAIEPMIDSFTITDGQLPLTVGVRNVNVPGDEDGLVNGQSRVVLSFPSLDTLFGAASGTFIFVVSDTQGSFSPVRKSFTVAQKVLPQGIRGRITAATGAPLADTAITVLTQDNQRVGGTVTDANGNYTFYAAPGDYLVIPIKSGWVADRSLGAVTVASESFEISDQTMAKGSLTVSGRLTNAGNGAPLPGIAVVAQSAAQSPNDLFGVDFTDANGHYSASVSADVWDIGVADSGGLAQVGCIPGGLRTTIVSGSLSNLDFAASNVTALIYGTITDDLGVPLIGFGFQATDDALRTVVGATFAPGGNYALGVLPGRWNVSIDQPLSTATGYLGLDGTNLTLGAGQALRVDFVAPRITAYIIGRAVDTGGSPLTGVTMNAIDPTGLSNFDVTDSDGGFRIGVVGGRTWELSLSPQDAAANLVLGPLMDFSVKAGSNVSDVAYVAPPTTAQITGSVKDNRGNPVSVGVEASTVINGIMYRTGSRTDLDGRYSLPVVKATWQVSLSCDDLTVFGFPCPPAQNVDVTGDSATSDFRVSLTVPPLITTASFQAATQGDAYTAALSASGGQPPYIWSLSPGSSNLPTGLHLAAGGVIGGTSIVSGTFAFSIRVTGADGATADRSYTLLILPGFAITDVSLDRSGNAIITYPSETSFYYILYRGALTNITEPIDMSLGQAGAGTLSIPTTDLHSTFFRIARVPIVQPLDTDRDGIDDVFELNSNGRLNPLDPSDALKDYSGDFMTALEKYNLGLPTFQTNLGTPTLSLAVSQGQTTNLAPASLSLQASLSGSHLVPGAVELYENGNNIGASLPPQYSWQLNDLSAGIYTFKARAMFGSTVLYSDTLSVAVQNPADGNSNRLERPALPVFDFKDTHAAAIASDGTLWTWGIDRIYSGKLGIGFTHPFAHEDLPTKISSIGGWESVAVGSSSTLALRSDGTIWFCGSITGNDHAYVLTQVGTDNDWERVFVAIKPVSGALLLGDTLFGVKRDGSLWTWGWQTWGVNGGLAAAIPSPKLTSFNRRCVGMSPVSMDLFGPLLVGDDGGLYVNTVASGTPVYAQAIAGQSWIQVAWHDIANSGLGLQADGSLWYLQPVAQDQPTLTSNQIQAGTRWKSINTGAYGSFFALKDDGSVWVWDSTNLFRVEVYPEFGPHTTVPTNSLTGVSWLSVAEGDGSALGLNQDGTLWEWGAAPITDVPCVTLDQTNFFPFNVFATNLPPVQLLQVPFTLSSGTSGANASVLTSSTNAFAPGSIDATGNLPVQFTVDSCGAATFSLPISVPPGTAGMQPSLAIAYSSHGGNGLLGMGGSLSGLSVITRAAKTIAQDEATGGVNFDSDDRFALDGQRLVAVNGNYGANGTEYRTEMDSFDRIISFGQSGHGPAYFRVWTKSGQIFEYGGTADSRLVSNDGVEVILWTVNQISDHRGNYLSVSYFQDNANGEYLPLQIGYGGNVNASAPYASIVFGYEDRPDIVHGRVGIYPVQVRHRLVSLQTSVNKSPVLQYHLAYDQGNGTGRSRLRAVWLCDANGICFPPTRFDDWQDMTYPLDFDIQHATPGIGYDVSANKYTYLSGDFDGDGRTDMIHLLDDGHYDVWLNDGSGKFKTPRTVAYPVNNPDSQFLHFYFIPGDFNGDGRTDFFHLLDGAHAETWLAQPDGTFKYIDLSSSIPTGYWLDQHPNYRVQYYAGDWNGDGRTDLIHIVADNTAKVWLSRGDGTFDIFEEHVAEDYNITRHNDKYFPCDLNGDGKTDLIHFVSSTNYFVWIASGDGHFQRVNKAGSYDLLANDATYISGDFNGDGRTDLVHFDATDSAHLWLGKGNGDFDISQISASEIYAPCLFTNAPGAPAYDFQGYDRSHFAFKAADFNGDGKTDLVHLFNKTEVFIWISNGDGTFKVTHAVPPTLYDLKGDAHFDYFTGDFNGDGKTDLLHVVDKNGVNIWYGLGPFPDIPTQITDGQGNSIALTYKPLTDPTAYTPESNATYPRQDMRGPLYVVASQRLSDGAGGEYEIRQTYAGAKADLAGRGFLGFRSIQARDMRDGIKTQTDYRQDFPFTGEVASAQLQQFDGRLINSTVNTWADTTLVSLPPLHFVHLAQSQVRSYELDGSLISTTTTSKKFDDYGNSTYVLVDSGDGFAKTTTSEFKNDANGWILGRLTRSQVASAAPGQPTLTRSSAFGYYDDGVLQYEEIEPDNPALRLRTDYQYDVFGNKTRATVSGLEIGTRASSTTFDLLGRFPLRATNALGQVVSFQYDARFGVLTDSIDLNSLPTHWRYDSFGRKLREDRADGTFTQWIYSLGDGDSPRFATYRLQTLSSGQPPSASYFDKLGRVLRKTNRGFNNETVFQDTQYDEKGRVSRSSRPYFTGDPIYWTQYSYDDLGRTLTETLPDNSTTATKYGGLTSVVTNALGQTLTQIKNSQGELVEAIDDYGRRIHHDYDAFGNLINTTDPAGNTVTMRYDLRGRKISMDDPDAGHWSYTYDVLGQMFTQRDSKNQVLTNTYDLLGRLIQRIEPEGISDWLYDTSVKGVGKLALAQGPGGYTRTNSYDALGRPRTTTSTIAGAAYSFTTTYDSLSRVDQLIYPSGIALKHSYTGNGYLASISNLTEGTLVWRANAMNAASQLTSDTLGNGVTTTRAFDPARAWIQTIQSGAGGSVQDLDYSFNTLGTLTRRRDLRQGLSEAFLYDHLNRLTNAAISGRSPKSYLYDQLGNLTLKSDVGSYSYGANGGGPHAASSAGGAEYFYDADGNQIGGNGRSVSYSSFNKPLSIAKGADTSSFAYDCDHARVSEVSTVGGVTSTTTFVNGLYEVVTARSIEEQRHYFSAGGSLVAIYARDLSGGTPTATRTRYVHTDHLGSIETLSDETGAAVERFSYDPHGKRRDAAWNDIPSGSLVGQTTERAFTGHLQLDSLDIINMGGRIYDPVLGRMLNPDPFVQNLANLQAFNRYTYVINNPLSLTDPTGYFFNNIAHFFRNYGREIGAIAAGAIITYASAGAGAPFAGALIGGAASGAISSRGDARAILISTATAAAFYGVGSFFEAHTFGNSLADYALKTAAHGLVGGVSSSVQGGGFSAGFTSAAFTEAVSGDIDSIRSESYSGLAFAARVTASAMAGGYAEELGGGKFKNGAITGAFGYLFNDASHLDEGRIESDLWDEKYDGIVFNLAVSVWLPVERPFLWAFGELRGLLWAGEASVAAKTIPVWPKTAEEMSAFLKVEGKAIPDTLSTPGRNKTVWELGESKITIEQHPYHPEAPDWHTDPHWHLDIPGNPRQRYVPGERIPGY